MLSLQLLLAFLGEAAVLAFADDVRLYFGVGCFWHVQHEFIKAEESILGRSDLTYTALSGYAGGQKTNAQGTACYNDYGNLGHTEVVGLEVPQSFMAEFAAVFWKLFVGKDRVDVMDRGPSYRAALGLPGGILSPLLAVINASQEGNVQQLFRLEKGSGNDRDTLGEALVWVYDSDEYPFYQAELYHQFHDDFMAGGDYPADYNVLGIALSSNCRMMPTGCPSDTGAAPAGCKDSRSPSLIAPSSGASVDAGIAAGGGSGGGSGGFMIMAEGTTSASPDTGTASSAISHATVAASGHVASHASVLVGVVAALLT